MDVSGLNNVWLIFNRLVVQVVDKGTPRLSSMCTVEIQVVDINDNAPTLQPLGVVKLPESKYDNCWTQQ